MEKIVIIGGGIIGMTLANYLDTTKYQVTVVDDSTGQATKASAGIISPWLSKRRNKRWYQLAKDGAAFFEKLAQDFSLTPDIYQRSGTLIIRPENQLSALAQLAEERRQAAPEIGEVSYLSPEETQQALPLLKPLPALKISGGGRLDGAAYLTFLAERARNNGVVFIQGKATLHKEKNWVVTTADEKILADAVCLTAGPGIGQLLEDIYQVDVRPQKGQLLAFELPKTTESMDWPVAMLEGEGDLIPFANGKILLGATHENDGGWDLTPTEAAKQQLLTGIGSFLAEPDKLFAAPMTVRVGTRAYTSDFAPFFGPLPSEQGLVVASGLGSSGLTTGPYIGYLLAEHFNQHRTSDESTKRFEPYTKPLSTYITEKK
jgi:glycine/D-amino acid oxidase-like deaminating enzyme